MEELISTMPQNFIIQDAMLKCWNVVHSHEKICVSVSGGADSDNLVDMIIKCGGKEKSTFVFFNTGMEYDATKRHLEKLNEKYGIKIQTIPPVKPIPLCVREHGVPFWSKHASEMIMRLQKHDFQWEDEPLDVLLEKYPHCRSALRWWCNDYKKENGDNSRLNIDWAYGLKEFMIANPPTFKISAKCCHYAKKEPARKYSEANDFDLECNGVRKAEGGYRATAIKTCFSAGVGRDTYRPLFWFSNADRAEYETHYEIEHSECYRVWGMCRTGCAGCPFGKDFEQELEIVKIHEPKFYKAMLKVFGESYEYTRRYLEFRERLKQNSQPANCEQLKIDFE